MTTRLRFADFDTDGERFDLGGRIVLARNILSVSVQRRVSAAFLAYLLVAALLVLAGMKAGSAVALLSATALAALCLAGARHEWRHPYVLVLVVHQLGTFEVVGIPKAVLPALGELVNLP